MTAVLDLSPGALAWLGDVKVTVTGPAGLDAVLVDDGSGALKPVPVSALSGDPAVKEPPRPDIHSIPQEDWNIARRREQAIRPLVDSPHRTKTEVREVGRQLGVSGTVVYRLIRRYVLRPETTTLLPNKGGRTAGELRVDDDVERIMAATIEEMYLDRQKVKGKDVADEVRRRCKQAGVRPPAVATVYRRLHALPSKDVLKARRGTKAAQDRFMAVFGHFPETAWPLQVIQIDHTLVDVIVVDQVHRKPIGRPWLTLAIDIYSRMVAGFLLSLDPPSATSVALCLVHAVCRKDDWLARHRIDAKWPVWGMPDTIHVDNAKEFHSEALRRGCEQYGIRLDYRPVRTPRYGGHIERLIGTMMGKVHMLPGTTFSNIHEKGSYDPEKHACLTLSETEEWLALGIDVYHRQIHSALGIPPVAEWERGILGSAEEPGRGLPAKIVNPDRFLIDFLPIERRAVTREGVELFHVHYWSDVLRRYVKDGARYTVRYDPRDLSRAWFLAPDQEYYPMPYRRRHRPPISLWEHRAAVAQLREEGRRLIDEAAIFDRIERQRAIIAEAAETTKRARRQSERIRTARQQAAMDQKPGVATPLPEPEETRPAPPPKRFDVEEW